MCGHLPAWYCWGKGGGECESWGVVSGSMEGPLEVHHESLFGVWVVQPPPRSHSGPICTWEQIANANPCLFFASLTLHDPGKC